MPASLGHWPMADPAALLALAVDALFGWPDRLYRMVGHPVGTFARLLDWAARHGNQPRRSFASRRAAGIAAMIALVAVVIAATQAVQILAAYALGPWTFLAAALMAWPALAQRSLYTHVRRVADTLETQGLKSSQQAVSQICGRDTAALDEAGVSRAAIESLAESLSDGVVAPLFWLLVGGLPALWAYKAINTADSLIGHKDDEWRAFGWAAARLDDLANLLPARLSAILLCIAGGRRGGEGWLSMRRDAHRHASPNSGWPEAAMAGVLKLRLAGPLVYDGVSHPRPWIGDGRRQARSQDIRAALRLYLRSLILLWLLTGAFLWAQ